MTFLPYSLFSPFIGVLIDRWNRRKPLIGANGFRTVILAGIVIIGLARIGDAALYVLFLLILAGTRLLLAIKAPRCRRSSGEGPDAGATSISQAGSALFQRSGRGWPGSLGLSIPS